MNYTEYMIALIIMGILTAINLFCCIVVFTFRAGLVVGFDEGVE